MTLEDLLNTLIQRGWKPRGYNDIKKITVENNKNVKQKVIHLRPEIGVDTETLTRFICVKESLLRQFVCENGMINIPGYKSIIRQGVDTKRHKYYGKDYRYWLCESSLKDESELESFILDNIKIGNEQL